MDISDKPMETIQQWQDWYRAHRTIAELDAPGVSKDSRENLHNTHNATNVMSDWTSFLNMDNNDTYKQKATEYFADTICEFIDEMSGQELYDCFKEAVDKYYNSQKEQFENLKQFHNAVYGKSCQKTCQDKYAKPQS